MHQTRGQSIFGSGTDTYTEAEVTILTISTAVFGSLHCLAWNFTFSSLAERMIWRVSSIVIISAPIVCLVVNLVSDSVEYWVATQIVELLLSAYCVARLMIIGIAFSSLRSMPSEVYITTWSKYIPDVQ